MDRAFNQPRLSIVVPVLNEAQGLQRLFGTLEAQRDLAFEAILCDGGSRDDTLQVAGQLASSSSFPCRVLSAPRGRGLQLNFGASRAAAETLLFLHADSSFDDPHALANALQVFDEATAQAGHQRLGGHFGLRFAGKTLRPSLAYYYYECKARLDRPHCTHGDQGMMLRRTFFEEIGRFDESLPLLEDTRLAEAIRQRGRWILLPAEIYTSPRRFEREGLLPRQQLNAVILNFAAIGWEEPFRALPEIYRSQDRAQRLCLAPFFDRFRQLLKELSPVRRASVWYRTGDYVRSHAWQLAFAWDVRRNFRCGLHPGPAPAPVLEQFDCWYDRITDNPCGRFCATLFVWGWFHLALLWLRLRNR